MRNPNIHFIRLHYAEAEVDQVAIPAFLIYYQGELVANMVGLMNEYLQEKTITVSTLEDILKRYLFKFLTLLNQVKGRELSQR